MRLRPPLALLVLPALAACGGGGSAPSADPGGPIDPPSFLESDAPGIVGAVALGTNARVDFRLPGSGFEAALFAASSPDTVFSGAPLPDALSGDFALVAGLAPDDDAYLGLGVRATPPTGEPYAPAGGVVRVNTGAPLFVDPTADPGVADGLSPETAFPDLLTGLLTAGGNGGGSVLVRAAIYSVGSLPLLDGVDVYGGFDGSFDLATRGAAETVLSGGVGGQGLLAVTGQEEPNAIDGIRFDGMGSATYGVDVSDAGVEIRNCLIEGCDSRGIRLRNEPGEPTREARVIATTSRQNGADGLSAAGAWRLTVDSSRFDLNVQEGLDVADLVANDGEVAELTIRGSGFFGNGAQGVDADLAAPELPGASGGLFRIAIEDCAFDLNGAEGLLIDQDHEGVAGWTAEIEVRGVRSRANSLEGIRIDADADSTILLHRVAAFGNGSDGVWISSEDHPGLAVVSCSALVANAGAGLRASLGNRAVSASHCVLAANAGGGFVSDTLPSGAASSVYYLQPNPSSGVESAGEVVLTAPTPAPFANAPEEFATAIAAQGGALTLAAPSDAFVGMAAELADDDVERSVVSAGGSQVVVEPAPEIFVTPGAVLLFAPGAPVIEDWSPSDGSVLFGAGMAPPGGPATDAGPFGAPAGGAPGSFAPTDAELFRVASTDPPASEGLAPSEPLRISFAGGTLDETSVVPSAVLVLGAGGAVPATVAFSSGDLLVTPPGAGWGPGPLVFEIFEGLVATDGRPLAAGIVIPIAAL